MNVKAFLLASVIGLSTPAIADIAIAPPAVAGDGLIAPLGTFSNRTWKVTFGFDDQGTYTYTGVNQRNGDSIFLANGYIDDSNYARTVTTWNNSGYVYQVAWRPNDPNVMRLEVFQPNGRRILNQLLYCNGVCD